jgi:hypothetical protein
MPQHERGSNDGRAIEALAQALYETEDPGRIAWAKRTAIVREPWLLRARRQLKAAQQSSGDASEAAGESTINERKPT